MLKSILTAAVFLAAPVQAETLRQFHAETTTPLSDIATALEQRLPENMVAPLGEGTLTVAYSGDRVPPALAGFLEASFENMSPDTSGQSTE